MGGLICAVTSFDKLSCQASIGCQAKQLVLPSVQLGFIRANSSRGDCCCLEAVSCSFSGGAQSLAGVVVSEGIDMLEAFDGSAASNETGDPAGAVVFGVLGIVVGAGGFFGLTIIMR
ncbi:hypothetical protein Ancab_004414, partial [Ancistrocladus abbreviatus]